MSSKSGDTDDNEAICRIRKKWWDPISQIDRMNSTYSLLLLRIGRVTVGVAVRRGHCVTNRPSAIVVEWFQIKSGFDDCERGGVVWKRRGAWFRAVEASMFAGVLQRAVKAPASRRRKVVTKRTFGRCHAGACAFLLITPAANWSSSASCSSGGPRSWQERS